MDRAESRRSRHLRRPSRRRTRRTRAAPMVMRCAHHNAEPELMLQSEILDAGTLCVASDDGWNLGRDKKVRGAAVVVSSTGNPRGSTGARRRPRRRSGPSRPRPRSPPKRVSRCRPRGCRRSASARRPPRGAARARSAPHRLRSRPGGREVHDQILPLYNFSLVVRSPHGFQTACSQAYYTVFSDSISDPLERHNSALASRTLPKLCECQKCQGRSPAGSGSLEPLRDSSCGVLTPGRAPTPARGVERRAASHVSVENRNQQSNRSRLYLRRSKTKNSTKELAGYPDYLLLCQYITY